MTQSEYDKTRKLPERIRATKNGKRAVDSFIKSVRDRTAAEHPEWLEDFDKNLTKRLMMLYFYFTKYIVNRWDTKGMMVYTGAVDDTNIYYTRNLLNNKDKELVECLDDMFLHLWREQ